MSLLKLEEAGSLGNCLELNKQGDWVWIEIDNPWSGDTETGLGRSASFTISIEQAARLAEELSLLVRQSRAATSSGDSR